MSNIVDLMKENEIELEWLFTLAKLNDHEGLMYFEPIVEKTKLNDHVEEESANDDEEVADEELEVMNLKPQCFIIDGTKFVYDEELDNKIVINAIDDVVTLTRVDGIQLNIDTKTLSGFPFMTSAFSNKTFDIKIQKPEGYVEVD